jgi:hypothetical protein
MSQQQVAVEHRSTSSQVQRPHKKRVLPTIVKHDIYGDKSGAGDTHQQLFRDRMNTEDDLDHLIKDYSESTFSEIDTNALKRHFNIDDLEEKYGS